MRVGGVSRSYGNHFLVVGDAAGQVDPLTGGAVCVAVCVRRSCHPPFGLAHLTAWRVGGIHFAMEAAKIAAETLVEAFREGDLTARRLKAYQQRWRKAFGWDFWLYEHSSSSSTPLQCALSCVTRRLCRVRVACANGSRV